MIEFNTIHWLPRHLAEMTEWQEICKAYDIMLSKAFSAMDLVQSNQYLESLTEVGCEIWERLLGITPASDSSIEARRQAIIGRLSSDLPYTEVKLREALEATAGSGNVTLTVSPESYGISIELSINDPSIIGEAQSIAYKMRPANMTVRIGVTYSKTDKVYLGNAYKHTKVVAPTNTPSVDPLEDVTLFSYSGKLLTDSYGDPLRDNT